MSFKFNAEFLIELFTIRRQWIYSISLLTTSLKNLSQFYFLFFCHQFMKMTKYHLFFCNFNFSVDINWTITSDNYYIITYTYFISIKNIK